MNYKKDTYFKAVSIAEFIIEGHTVSQTSDEFGISRTTIQRHLNFLADYGITQEEMYKNRKLFITAKKQLQDNIIIASKNRNKVKV